MAKKKSEIVINNNELTPTVLYVKQDKKKSNIFSIVWISIIFIILVVGAYFLPEISEYINKYINPDTTSVYVPRTEEGSDQEDDDTEEEDVSMYTITDTLEISTDIITLSGFSVSDGILYFTINNNTESLIELDDYDYFLELYSDSDVLVERIMLTNQSIAPLSSQSVSYDMDSTATKVMLREISTVEYADYTVSTDTAGNGTLVCTKDYETVNYLVSNNKLYAIQDIYRVPINSDDYTYYYSTFQTLNTTYNMITGVSAVINLEDEYLVFTTVINLSTLTDTSININDILYESGTDAKIMMFELEAQGYSCS